MFAHPLILSVVLADALALGLLCPAAVMALRIVLAGASDPAVAAQQRLQARAKCASVLARCAAVCLVLAALGWLVAITVVLPDAVTGAMCGSGVIEAMGGLGYRVIAFHGLSIAMLAGWHLVEGLSRAHSSAPFMVGGARALLLATPLVVLAVADTLRAWWGVDLSQPVDCCSAVYRSAWPSQGATADALRDPDQWLVLSSIGTALLVGLALRLRSGGGRSSAVAGTLGLVALGWAPVTGIAVIDSLAVPPHGLLHHPCPWCPFRTEHYLIGYPLLGAMMVVLLEALAAVVATRLAATGGAVTQAARGRARVASLRLVVGLLLFWAVAGLPALAWRIRVATWLG